MIVPFREYMHEEWEGGLPDALVQSLSNAGYDTSEDSLEQLEQKCGRPFYEVTLNCELDTDTGRVTIVSAAL